ncbi:hypothetical protein BN2476_560057 [Paraburkholderia piptadeniae]|uniref:Uncharacterized protein n=1 Tax=Paraburkholderia piptadeniae TaxID=1701573 RepID=A0A1N7SIQ2_9BURK|nr:hypothetical protein BN2476_560057 [Paraburkholderia piptadeniae]
MIDRLFAAHRGGVGFDAGAKGRLASGVTFEQGKQFRAQSITTLSRESMKREKWQHGSTPVRKACQISRSGRTDTLRFLLSHRSS